MPGITHHERFYRGNDLVEQPSETSITICGAGALGSNLTDSLTRQGATKLRVIDNDRVEEHNVGTQIYGMADVGAWKVDVLRGHVFRSVEVDIDARRAELSARTVRKCLRDSDVVIDAFDNTAAREIVTRYCREHGLPCLHVGLAADYAEVVWNQNYSVPDDGGEDVCDYPLARNIVQFAVTVASEVLIRWIADGKQADYSLTLRDFSVRTLEPANADSPQAG